MTTVVFSSCKKLDCCIGNDVIMCLTGVSLLSGKTTLEAEILNVNCLNYTLSYDEELLEFPEVPIIPENITGVFCLSSCLATWVQEIAGTVLVEDTDSINLTISVSAPQTLSADVNISEDEGNTIEIREDGLFAEGGGGGGGCESFTPGSVIFTVEGPTCGEDNANFFYDDTEKELRLGGVDPYDSKLAIRSASDDVYGIALDGYTTPITSSFYRGLDIDLQGEFQDLPFLSHTFLGGSVSLFSTGTKELTSNLAGWTNKGFQISVDTDAELNTSTGFGASVHEDNIGLTVAVSRVGTCNTTHTMGFYNTGIRINGSDNIDLDGIDADYLLHRYLLYITGNDGSAVSDEDSTLQIRSYGIFLQHEDTTVVSDGEVIGSVVGIEMIIGGNGSSLCPVYGIDLGIYSGGSPNWPLFIQSGEDSATNNWIGARTAFGGEDIFGGLLDFTPQARVHIKHTDEQLRIGYDDDYYSTTVIDAAGNCVLDLVAAAGTPTFTFNKGVIPASMADGSAVNGTIYYSTTASKLVYKDSGGSVHALY